MNVGELIKKLNNIDKDKMCIYRVCKDSVGWANLDIVEKENEVTFCGDFKILFED